MIENYNISYAKDAPKEPIKARRGTELVCKGWIQEAALRMLQNNLEQTAMGRVDRLRRNRKGCKRLAGL